MTFMANPLKRSAREVESHGLRSDAHDPDIGVSQSTDPARAALATARR